MRRPFSRSRIISAPARAASFPATLGLSIIGHPGRRLEHVRRVDEHDLSFGLDQQRQKLSKKRIGSEEIGSDTTGKTARSRQALVDARAGNGNIQAASRESLTFNSR